MIYNGAGEVVNQKWPINKLSKMTNFMENMFNPKFAHRYEKQLRPTSIHGSPWIYAVTLE